jgi:hypothetical protein
MFSAGPCGQAPSADDEVGVYGVAQVRLVYHTPPFLSSLCPSSYTEAD